MAGKQIPVHPGLFTEGKSPQLVGSKCADCSEVTFPKQSSCPKCTSEKAEEILLSRKGTLWTWTIQHFAPPSPPYDGPQGDDFVLYGVGYIELEEGVRVESRLTINDEKLFKIGMTMELGIEKYRTDAVGNDVMTFVFQPAS